MTKTAWDAAADHFGPDMSRDPGQWCNDKSIELWSAQLRIIESVRDHRNTAVKSCHSAGKSFGSAAVGCWWIDVHPPGSAFIVTSAPTGDQVKAILWREINRLHEKANLPGRTNLTEWYVGNELVGIGRKPSEYSPAAFQGIHAKYLLVILDEACGIPLTLWDAASTLASNFNGRMLAIGNPDDPDSEFARKFKDPNWNCLQISAFDTPNFTGEAVSEELTMGLVAKEWVDEKRVSWQENSALWFSKVLGEFPENAESGVVPLSWVEQCKALELTDGQPVELGFDIGEGGDETVLTERRGSKLGQVWAWREPDPMKTVGEAVIHIIETGATKIKVDVIGAGWGVAGRLRELFEQGVHQAEVVEVNVSERASEPEKFLNKRAEMWWNVGRENSRNHLWDLAGIEDETVAELTAHHYEVLDSNGKIKIEPKDDIKKRLGRSPDHADSLLLAFDDGYGEADTSGNLALEARLPGTNRYSRRMR